MDTAFVICQASTDELRKEMARCLTEDYVPFSWIELIGDELLQREEEECLAMV